MRNKVVQNVNNWNTCNNSWFIWKFFIKCSWNASLLERFKTAGENFDVPFLKETIGVQNKLEEKILVKFVGKFNEEQCNLETG